MQYFAYSQKAFVYKYVVMLSDVDQFKHMSFANYLKLMFLATDALLIGYAKEVFLIQYRFKLRQSRMQFKRQTTAGDNILIKINSSEIAHEGFVLLFTFVIEGNGELVGLGRQTYEFCTSSGKKIPLLEEIKTLLEVIRVDEAHLIYKY